MRNHRSTACFFASVIWDIKAAVQKVEYLWKERYEALGIQNFCLCLYSWSSIVTPSCSRGVSELCRVRLVLLLDRSISFYIRNARLLVRCYQTPTCNSGLIVSKPNVDPLGPNSLPHADFPTSIPAPTTSTPLVSVLTALRHHQSPSFSHLYIFLDNTTSK